MNAIVLRVRGVEHVEPRGQAGGRRFSLDACNGYDPPAANRSLFGGKQTMSVHPRAALRNSAKRLFPSMNMEEAIAELLLGVLKKIW